MFLKFLLQFYLFLSCLKVYNSILKGADSMPLPKEHTYTIKDIYALPEGERAELIDGQIYMIGAPTYLHQALSMELSATIRNYIRSRKGSCQVLQAPLAVTLFPEYRYEEDAAPMIAPFDQTLTVGIYGDFEINIAKLLEEAGIK